MKQITSRTVAVIVLLSSSFLLTPSCRKDSAAEPRHAFPLTQQYKADVATQWFELLTEITRTKPYFSPQSLRIFSYSGLALYESVVPGMPAYQSVYKHFTGNTIAFDKSKNIYWPAAANAAIARISSRIMENYPAPNLTAVKRLEDSLNAVYQSKTTADQLNASNEFGRYVADQVYEWSKQDGTLNADGSLATCPAYTPVGGPGKWVPTPPLFLPAAGACQGSIKTFVPNIAQTVLAPPPPVYSTDTTSAFYRAAADVFNSRNNITSDQTRQFNNWRDAAPNYNPIAHMLRVTTGIIMKENVNLQDAAAIYAQQTMAASDAIVAVFKSKFHYALIRPVTYVRDVMGQTSWLSLPVTPQTPSYPDELAATASSVAVLEKYFGPNYAFVDSIQKPAYGEWAYTSLHQMLGDIVQARVSGGTNFRFAGEAGVIQGRLVGNMVHQLPFKKN